MHMHGAQTDALVSYNSTTAKIYQTYSYDFYAGLLLVFLYPVRYFVFSGVVCRIMYLRNEFRVLLIY